MATPSITSFTSLFYFISYTFPTFFPLFPRKFISRHYCGVTLNPNSISTPSQHVPSIKQSLLFHLLFHLAGFSNFHHHFPSKFTSSQYFLLMSLRIQFQLNLNMYALSILALISIFISSGMFFFSKILHYFPSKFTSTH